MFAYAMTRTSSTGACFKTPASSCCTSASAVALSDIALWVVSVFVLACVSLLALANCAIIGRIITLAVLLMVLVALVATRNKQTPDSSNPA